MGKRGTAALWVIACSGPLLVVATGVLVLATRHPLPGDRVTLENLYPNVVFGAFVPLLGALILSRLPRHPIGWLFLGCGLASALTITFYGYARLALYGDVELPLGVAVAWVSNWEWALGVLPLVTVGVLLFPDGRLPGAGWRYLLWLDLAAVALMIVSTAFVPGPLSNAPVVDNPVGIPLSREMFSALEATALALFLIGFVGAAVATVWRWRQARGAERAQLSWFAFAVLLLVCSIALPLPTVLSRWLTLVAVPLVPFAVALAILRRNLYGIEVVVRRSLVYAALTAVLLLVYAATVVTLGAVLQGRADTTVALVATAVVAIAFAPARERLQRAADRLLYGDRGTPYSVLASVGRQLDLDPGTSTVLAEVAETVASSLRLPYARVDVIGQGEDPPLSAEWGTRGAALHEVPLSFRGEPVGRLSVTPRTARDPFSASDLRLLDDLGRQIGVAAYAMLLGQALQRSRVSLVATREDERRRIRRDLHDGLGPALAGIALGLDAVSRLAEQDATTAAALAQQLKDEVQASLSDVRRLVEDLRPPALDQLGLIGAVRQQAGRLTERDPQLSVTVESASVPTLPAAVEVAAYRIATEALNNVSRHAVATRCRVSIGVDEDGSLRVDVEDDGAGMPDGTRPGVGLTAMRERATELGGTCEVGRGERGGTRVRASIPVVA